MPSNKQLSEHFTSREFDSPDAPYSGLNMKPSFICRLECARVIYNYPMRINSGYRTPEHNAKIGGVADSSHLKGCAADIHCPTTLVRNDLLRALILAGFKRIGIGKNFIHVDTDEAKLQNLIWLY